MPLRSVPYSTFYLQICVAILFDTRMLEKNFLIYVYCFIVLFAIKTKVISSPGSSWRLRLVNLPSLAFIIIMLSRFFGVIRTYSFRSTEVQNFVSTRHAMDFINMVGLIGNSKFLKLEAQNRFKIQLTPLKSPLFLAALSFAGKSYLKLFFLTWKKFGQLTHLKYNILYQVSQSVSVVTAFIEQVLLSKATNPKESFKWLRST